MTPEAARIVLLEDALIQAQHTTRFLHNCLTEPEGHKYAYPNQTLDHLREWAELVPPPKACFHSMHKTDCPACQNDIVRRRQLAEAKKTLAPE